MEEIETVKAASRLQGPGQREEAVNRLRGLETSGRNLCAQLGLDSSQEGLGRIGGKLAGHIGENRYIVSYATDNRSKCQSVECRQYLRCGETRIGKQPPSVRLGHGKTRWYHLDCAFVAFRRVCRKSKTIEAPSDLEGFETMSEGDKERVRGLIADHVEERAALGPPAKPVEAKVPEGWSCNCDPDYACGDCELLPPMPRAPRDDRAPQHPRRPPPPPTPAADGAACLWCGADDDVARFRRHE
ncbi:N-acylsphingosine amidohydrolase [Aureococcus anophagefferens]|nr:N-acylsphingosine amidohydrolase [Aureococcus anophagefferens]